MSSDPTQHDPERGAEISPAVSPVGWLLADPVAAAQGLAALAQEPLPRAERKQLERLVDVLRSGTADASEIGRHQLTSRLMSHEFAWLPAASPSGRSTAAGEADMLLRIVRSMQQQPHAPWRLALVYPLTLLAVAILVLIMLSVLVVPPFEEMFADWGFSMPAPTMLLFWLVRLVRMGVIAWLALVLVVVALFVAISWIYRSLAHRSNFILRRRGSASELHAMARFARSLAESIQTGSPLQAAIRTAAAHCGHPHYARASNQLALQLADDSPFRHPALASSDFPANLMLAIGGAGKSGDRPNVSLLMTLAEMYEERAARRVQASAAILGIVAVVVVALFVGFAALALLMPLVSLISGLA